MIDSTPKGLNVDDRNLVASEEMAHAIAAEFTNTIAELRRELQMTDDPSDWMNLLQRGGQ
ncbi:MAG TPA: hypothetical protein VFX60_10220 [Micromonospora sp.]|nr:hypothetical protein [Micromonospora sp.]